MNTMTEATKAAGSAGVGIGLLGFGTIGQGVARLIAERSDEIARRTGRRLTVTAAASRDWDQVEEATPLPPVQSVVNLYSLWILAGSDTGRPAFLFADGVETVPLGIVSCPAETECRHESRTFTYCGILSLS